MLKQKTLLAGLCAASNVVCHAKVCPAWPAPTPCAALAP